MFDTHLRQIAAIEAACVEAAQSHPFPEEFLATMLEQINHGRAGMQHHHEAWRARIMSSFEHIDKAWEPLGEINETLTTEAPMGP